MYIDEHFFRNFLSDERATNEILLIQAWFCLIYVMLEISTFYHCYLFAQVHEIQVFVALRYGCYDEEQLVPYNVFDDGIYTIKYSCR